MSRHTTALEALLLDRLAAADLPERVGDAVFAAVAGDDAAMPAVANRPEVQADPGVSTDTKTSGIYLRSVRVAGFRGIGPEVTLPLSPGPGLTVVTGRNGCGKSSIAEAIEICLTGDNQRWSGRTAVWRDGWRNLHVGERSEIVVELAVDGRAGPTKIRRSWPGGARLDASTATAQHTGERLVPLDALGWRSAFDVYRPFLSYSELGGLIEGRQTEMHDAVQSILGLDQLLDAEKRLTESRRRLTDRVKRAKESTIDLHGRMDGVDDERARAAARALTGASPGRWDIDAVDSLVLAADPLGSDDESRALRELGALAVPDRPAVEAALTRYAAAAGRIAESANTPAGWARDVVGILATVLKRHEQHPGEACPVCTGRVLDDQWAADARTQMERLTALAEAAERAHASKDAAIREVLAFGGAAPPALSGAPVGGVDLAGARAAWSAWTDAVRSGPATGFVGLLAAHEQLRQAVQAVQQGAAEELRARDDLWRPLAQQLAQWLGIARDAVVASDELAVVEKARSWLKGVGSAIRNDRLAPFAKRSADVWTALRQESHVDLGPIRLDGSGPGRRVALDVTVDGAEGSALGVMSQGELHALGLALFMPRATTSDSPFRFVVIDDPVQSMDPAKVDGLAQVLCEVAASRQVVVFSHDDRLTESLRRLQLPATVWAVARREGSQVELRTVTDPVRLYLDDARAVAKADDLAEEARRVVVAGLCRSALEVACHEKVRRLRIGRGVPHQEVEEELGRAHKLSQAVALALFDDAKRGGDVLARINRDDRALGDAYVAARSGLHQPTARDLVALVGDASRLARLLRS